MMNQAAPRQGGQCGRHPSSVLASGGSRLASPLRPGGGHPVSGQSQFWTRCLTPLVGSGLHTIRSPAHLLVPLLTAGSTSHWLVPLLTGWVWFSLLTGWVPLVLGFPLGPHPAPPPAYGQQHLSTAPARLSSQTWTLLHVSGLEVSNASHSQYTQHHSSREQADPPYRH